MAQRSSELLSGLSTIGIGDFWSWQGLVVLLIVTASALSLHHRRVRRLATPASGPSTSPGLWASLVARLAPSALLSALAAFGYGAFRAAGDPGVLLLALLALGALMLVTRLALFVVTRVFVKHTRVLVIVERVAGWMIWCLAALALFQLLSPIITMVDGIAIPVAGTRASLLDVIRIVAISLLFIVTASYLGAVIERRVLAISEAPIGLRVAVAKVTRVFLIGLAVLLALNSVGIDLTAFTVIGGAIGVGLGFGLQRIASNFVSGFVLLGDRSIRPGDVITIGTRFGVVRELRARYVVVRDRDGVDTLIPNENIITSEVINWSYADRHIRLKLPVMISYQDDPRKAMALMAQAATAHPRVEHDPAPVSRIMGFADSGIELELRFWIRDPQDGVNNVRSDLFLAIWDAFQVAAITIPYPRRDIHIQGGSPHGGAPREIG